MHAPGPLLSSRLQPFSASHIWRLNEMHRHLKSCQQATLVLKCYCESSLFSYFGRQRLDFENTFQITSTADAQLTVKLMLPSPGWQTFKKKEEGKMRSGSLIFVFSSPSHCSTCHTGVSFSYENLRPYFCRKVSQVQKRYNDTLLHIYNQLYKTDTSLRRTLVVGSCRISVTLLYLNSL